MLNKYESVMNEEELQARVDGFLNAIGYERDVFKNTLTDIRREYIMFAIEKGGNGKTVMSHIDFLDGVISVL